MAVQFYLFQQQNRRALQSQRVFRDRVNPLDRYNDREMYKRYRFTRQGCVHLIDMLEEDLQPSSARNHAISASIQIFTALRYYATGSLLTCAGDTTGISIASASRAVRRVTQVLCRKRNEFVTFPHTPDEVNSVKRGFFQLHRFPNVVGAVDCTHVQLRGCPWGPNEHVFVNRKGQHSVNIQLICDPSYKITNVVARWPGSTHDSRILQASQIGHMFESGIQSGVLLGDSGYPLRPWLMTPLANPVTDAEHGYNRAQTSTRSLIEQVNGQLKNKFRCLLIGMSMEPARACNIVTACCVLFNISKVQQEPNLDAENDVDVAADNAYLVMQLTMLTY